LDDAKPQPHILQKCLQENSSTPLFPLWIRGTVVSLQQQQLGFGQEPGRMGGCLCLELGVGIGGVTPREANALKASPSASSAWSSLVRNSWPLYPRRHLCGLQVLSCLVDDASTPREVSVSQRRSCTIHYFWTTTPVFLIYISVHVASAATVSRVISAALSVLMVTANLNRS
jgi:hypothetical protein